LVPSRVKSPFIAKRGRGLIPALFFEREKMTDNELLTQLLQQVTYLVEYIRIVGSIILGYGIYKSFVRSWPKK